MQVYLGCCSNPGFPLGGRLLWKPHLHLQNKGFWALARVEVIWASHPIMHSFKIYLQDFSGGAVVKNLPANAEHMGSIPVWEDPTCRGATKPVRLEPVLHNKRSHHNEKPAHRNEEKPPLAATRESP